MSSEDIVVNRLTELIKSSTPSVTQTQDGLQITQNGKTFEIPFSKEGATVSKSVISKL